MKKGIKTLEKIGKIFLVLLFSFSQLSFPIEVLADELSEENQAPVEETKEQQEDEIAKFSNEEIEPTENETSSLENTEEETPVVDEEEIITKINGEETNEYTLTSDAEDKVVTISYGYSNDLKEEQIDFSKKLYGDYYYTYNLSETKSINITIHYEGDNNDILNHYISSSLTVENNIIKINGAKEGITKQDFLNHINIQALEEDYEVEFGIDLMNDTDLIQNGTIAVLTSNDTLSPIEIQYQIQINGDYNQDGLVNEEDSLFIVDEILNNSSDTNLDIITATNPVFKTGSWKNDLIAQDELENSLVNKKEINKGEELVVKYYITGLEKDQLTGIEGNINYNKELLELMNVEVTSALYGGANANNHFAYLLDNYTSNGIFMTLTFKTLKAGEANISIDDIKASLGVEAKIDSSIAATVTINDYGKGGDVEEEQTTNNNVSTPSPVPSTSIITPTKVNNVVAQTIKLSSDNLIKNLTIKGYTIDFDTNTLEYKIKVKNQVKSLDLEVTLNDQSASYEISGNKNFKVGENIVTIKVTAEDGSTRTYTLKVTREKAEEIEETEEKSSSKTIIIILIILVIIGLIYVIFKDDEEDNKESKK